MIDSKRLRIVVLGAALAWATSASADDGTELFAKGKFAEARDAFQSAIEKDGKSASAHAGLIRSRLRLDEWRDALRESRRATEVLPKDATLRALFGNALRRAGKLRAAGVEWRQAAALDPDDYDARIGLALAHQMDGDSEAAADVARRAASRAPNRPEAWLLLASSLEDLGRSMESADAAERLVKLAPTGKPWDLLLETLPGEIPQQRRLAATTPYALSAPGSRVEWKATFESGYLYLEVAIEGQESFPVVFDTGGSKALSVDEEFAKKLGLAKISDVPVRGATGKTLAWTTLVKKLDIGSLSIANVPAVVFDLKQITRALPRPFVGVLGVGWLQRHSMVIDFRNQTLAIEASSLDAHVSRPDRAIADEVDGVPRLRIPFWLIGDAMIVFEIEVNGEPVLALLDTGCPTVILSKSFVSGHTPADKLRAVPPMGGGVGEGAESEDWAIGQPMSFRIGGREFPVALSIGMPALDVILSPGSGAQVDFLLGNSFLATAVRARIDYANGVLTLEGPRKGMGR